MNKPNNGYGNGFGNDGNGNGNFGNALPNYQKAGLSPRQQELRDAIIKAVDSLEERKLNPTNKNVLNALGGGSLRDVSPLLHSVLAERDKLKLTEIADVKYRSEFVDAALERALELYYNFKVQEADRKVKQMLQIYETANESMTCRLNEMCEENRQLEERYVKLTEEIKEVKADRDKALRHYDETQRALAECKAKLEEASRKNNPLEDALALILQKLEALSDQSKRQRNTKTKEPDQKA